VMNFQQSCKELKLDRPVLKAACTDQPTAMATSQNIPCRSASWHLMEQTSHGAKGTVYLENYVYIYDPFISVNISGPFQGMLHGVCVKLVLSCWRETRLCGTLLERMFRQGNFPSRLPRLHVPLVTQATTWGEEQ
jgi:hypothetical protein